MAIGKYALDFKSLVLEGSLAHLNIDWSQVDFATLNDYEALGRSRHRAIRKFLKRLIDFGHPTWESVKGPPSAMSIAARSSIFRDNASANAGWRLH